MAAPPFTLAFEDLPPAAGELFARAFERGSEVDRRPTAGEWCAVLGQLADDLATCKADPGHRFWTGATDCPWCRIVARRGPDYFLGVSETAFVFLPDEPRLRELLRQLAEIEQTSLTTKIPPPALLIPPPSVIPRAIPPGMDRDLPLSIGFILSAALGGVVSLGCCLSVYALIIGLVLFVGSLIGFALVIWSSPFYREYSRRHQALVTSRREFHTAETLYLDSILELREGLDTGIHQARDLIDRCRLLPKQYQEEVADLANHLEELARKAHLANYFLTDATIPKIGDGRKQTLASHNINTAADIDPAVLCQIKGFGRALIEYLMQWREQCLEGFTFDRTQKVPEANQRAVAMAFSRKQRTLLGEAERQLDDLRQANAHLESERTRHLPRYQEAFTQALQAEADWNLFCEAYPMFKQAGR